MLIQLPLGLTETCAYITLLNDLQMIILLIPLKLEQSYASKLM